MLVAQWVVMFGLVIIAALAALAYFGRQRRANFEIRNEDGLLDELHDDLVAGEFVAAYMHAFRTGTPISRVVAAGLERFEAGKEAVFEAMNRALEEEQTRWHGALLGLTVSGALASALGVIGLALSLPRVLNGASLVELVRSGGPIVGLAIAIAVLSFVGHGALLKKMEQSRSWLHDTASRILTDAARTVVTSTKMTVSTPPQARRVVAGRKL